MDTRCGYERKKNPKSEANAINEQKRHLWVGEYLRRRKPGDENQKVWLGTFIFEMLFGF